MRGVAGLLPISLRSWRSIHPATWVTALTVAAVLVAVALYVGEKTAAYLPGKLTITSWKPPGVRDLSAPEQTQTSNVAKKAAREPFRQHEARLTPGTDVPKPQSPARAEPTQTGRASWYDLDGATASGETMDEDALSAAHRTFPLGSKVRVENLANGRSVVVRINDRGPFAADRIIDLSKAAAGALGMIDAGVAEVRLSLIEKVVASNSDASEAAPLQR